MDRRRGAALHPRTWRSGVGSRSRPCHSSSSRPAVWRQGQREADVRETTQRTTTPRLSWTPTETTSRPSFMKRRWARRRAEAKDRVRQAVPLLRTAMLPPDAPCRHSLAVAALLAARSASPPTRPLSPDPLAPASSAAFEALLAPLPTDSRRRRTRHLPHAVTVTLCSWSPRRVPHAATPRPRAKAPTESSSARGAARSGRAGRRWPISTRSCTTRTQSGQRLDAEAHAPGDGGAAPSPRDVAPRRRPSATTPIPSSQCAFRLLDLVDGVGGVTLDVLHESGASACKVTLGHAVGDGGASRCLVQGPQNEHRPGR